MYAHSVKNPQTIHFQRDHYEGEYHHPEVKYRYLCCGSFTSSKGTINPDKVTCKNCLRELERHDYDLCHLCGNTPVRCKHPLFRSLKQVRGAP